MEIMETIGKAIAFIFFGAILIAEVFLLFWVFAAYGLLGLILLIVVSGIVLPLLWMLVALLGMAIAYPFVRLAYWVGERRSAADESDLHP